ncbi:MAG TPA: hypothetical protein VFV38_29215 [Ktedonobacteraceae bacterium]|nr:hypothetical protein [Ktedonobacteraceae bacterium]
MNEKKQAKDEKAACEKALGERSAEKKNNRSAFPQNEEFVV